MKTLSTKSLIGTFALMASLSAPVAFAQSASPAAEQAPPAEQTSADAATQSAPATEAPAAAPQKKSWADVDGDKNGSLSKSEASSVPALSQVFDQADTNADGSLTAEEYKAYVAKAAGAKSNGSGG